MIKDQFNADPLFLEIDGEIYQFNDWYLKSIKYDYGDSCLIVEQSTSDVENIFEE